MVRPKQIAQDGASNGQVLTWNNSTQRWEPQTPSGGGGGSSTYSELLNIDFTSQTSQDFKNSDGTKTISGTSFVVANSGNMGTSGELELDGSDGTGRGLVFAVNGDNPGTSGTSGTATEIRIPFQQLDTNLNPTWPIRALIEYTLTGSATQLCGIFIDHDPANRGNAVNGYNSFGSYTQTSSFLRITKWESGSFTNLNSEHARTVTNRLFWGLNWSTGGNVGVYFNDLNLAGMPGSNFPAWKDLDTHGMHRPTEAQTTFFDAATWNLRFLFGGIAANSTFEWNVKSVRIEAIERD